MTLHFLNDVANDTESPQKSKIKSYLLPMGKLIKRIPGLRLLISRLPGSASRTHVESLSKPCDSTSVLEALPGKLDIKSHSPSILYLYPIHAVISSVVEGFILYTKY